MLEDEKYIILNDLMGCYFFSFLSTIGIKIGNLYIFSLFVSFMFVGFCTCLNCTTDKTKHVKTVIIWKIILMFMFFTLTYFLNTHPILIVFGNICFLLCTLLLLLSKSK